MAGRPKPPQSADPYPPGWEPFLAAINADLDDDTARLVFADWLRGTVAGSETDAVRRLPAFAHIRLFIETYRD